jgi:hypothetical protein
MVLAMPQDNLDIEVWVRRQVACWRVQDLASSTIAPLAEKVENRREPHRLDHTV